MAIPTEPQQDDIVVRQESRGGGPVFVLHRTSGTDQCLMRLKDEAMSQALRFGQQLQVGVWYAEGDRLRLIDDFRAGNRSHLQSALDRVRSEFLEMPGLRLTAPQLQRFCGILPPICQAVLDTLVSANFLQARPDGTYARVHETGSARLKPAKAALKEDAKQRRLS